MRFAPEIILNTIVVFQKNYHASIVIFSAFRHNLSTTAIILLQKNLIIVNGKICHHLVLLRLIFDS